MRSRLLQRSGWIIGVALYITSCASYGPEFSPDLQISPPAAPVLWEPTDWPGLKKLAYSGGENPVSLYALAVELDTPGLEFVFTPPPDEAEEEMRSLKVSVFAEQHNLTAAINGAPYGMKRLSYLLNRTHAPCDISGLYIYEGQQISPPVSYLDALFLLNDGSWQLASQESIPAGTQWAVGGFHIFLRNGTNTGAVTLRHPRTAVGLSEDRRTLFLVVVDGRQENSAGMSLEELGEWMLWLGAYEGINMDGGGSSTLVLRQNSSVQIQNSPSHRGRAGLERSVASHIGLRLPGPTL